MKKFAAVAGVVMAVVVVAPVAQAAPSVQPTKASVTAWTLAASTSSMTTRSIGLGDTVTTCKIAKSQASDCVEKIPGNADSQTVTNADASRQWFRTLPDGAWKSNKFAAHVNPVADTARFNAYNPFLPWTAKAGLGVTWSMKKANGDIIIESSIKNFGDDQAPNSTVTISTNGKRFTLAQGGSNGPDFTVTGVLKPVTVTIPN